MRLNKLYHRLNYAVEIIDKVGLIVVLICLLGIIGLQLGEIFLRTFLKKSFFGVYELTTLLGNWVYFIGICSVYKRSKDIEMEYFYNFLTLKGKKVLSLITTIGIFYFLIIITYYGYKLLLLQSKYTTHGLNIPNHLFSLPVFIGTILLLIIFLKKFIGLYINVEKP